MSHLLIVELPGGNDTDILLAAQQGGHRVSFLSADPEYYQGQEEVAALLENVERVIPAGNFTLPDVLSRLEAYHRRDRFDAVLCLQDLRIVEAAEIARALGLRFLDPAVARLTRDKAAVRRVLEAAGIAQPAFAMVQGPEELVAAVETMGLPVLVKPVDGFGSQNIFALRTPADLALLRQSPEIIISSSGSYGLGVCATGMLLVERLLAGQVIGCDTMTADGHHRLLGVNEKLLYAPPSFAIRGGCFTVNTGQFSKIESYVFAMLDAIGFDHGAAHVELMLTDNGPHLIEINPRLVGARIGRQISAARRCSVHDDVIALHHEARLPSLARLTRYGVTRWLAAPRAGVLEAIHLPAISDGCFVSTTLIAKPGERVTPPFDNADRLGCVITSGEERVAAETLAEYLIQNAQIDIADANHTKAI